MQRIRVWDLPTRLFHWALLLCVVGLIITGNIGGNAMFWHFRFGFAVLTLLLFRLVWGFIGGHWSRFAQFVFTPWHALQYALGRRTHDGLGHNPLGALSVFAMLFALLLQVSTGLISDDEIANMGPLAAHVSSATSLAATAWHKGYGKFILMALIVLHVLAIAFYKWARHKSLVSAMVHGDVLLPLPAQNSRDDARSRTLALLTLCMSAFVVYLLVR
jgi:cytochrome b